MSLLRLALFFNRTLKFSVFLAHYFPLLLHNGTESFNAHRSATSAIIVCLYFVAVLHGIMPPKKIPPLLCHAADIFDEPD